MCGKYTVCKDLTIRPLYWKVNSSEMLLMSRTNYNSLDTKLSTAVAKGNKSLTLPRYSLFQSTKTTGSISALLIWQARQILLELHNKKNLDINKME
jgi:hypothetical protein